MHLNICSRSKKQTTCSGQNNSGGIRVRLKFKKGQMCAIENRHKPFNIVAHYGLFNFAWVIMYIND